MKEPCELEKLNAAAGRSHQVFTYAALTFYLAVVLLHHPEHRTGFRLILIAYAVVFAVALIRSLRLRRLARSAACEVERDKVNGWRLRVSSLLQSPGVIQFAADDFWTGGRKTVRLLQDDNWTVVASFHRQNVANAPTIMTIYDANATPVIFSPEQRKLRIGSRRFCKVEFTPESVALINQLVQIVATI